MITIKHRYTNITLCEFDVDTVKQAAEIGKADLRGADLRGADLRGADLSGADLSGANLYGADLYGADLSGADLSGSNLYGADLYGADLSGADLSGANLYGADLSVADLYGADLYGADLYGSNLSGADLSGATIDGEKIKITPIQIQCGLKYHALITDNYMRLGCKCFTHAEWAEFDDQTIAAMDKGALDFWKQWKAPLLAMCTAHKEAAEKAQEND